MYSNIVSQYDDNSLTIQPELIPNHSRPRCGTTAAPESGAKSQRNWLALPLMSLAFCLAGSAQRCGPRAQGKGPGPLGRGPSGPKGPLGALGVIPKPFRVDGHYEWIAITSGWPFRVNGPTGHICVYLAISGHLAQFWFGFGSVSIQFQFSFGSILV